MPGVTRNGIHLTGYGYQWSAAALLVFAAYTFRRMEQSFADVV